MWGPARTPACHSLNSGRRGCVTDWVTVRRAARERLTPSTADAGGRAQCGEPASAAKRRLDYL